MNSIIRRGTAVGLSVAACALMAGCDDSYLDQSSARSQQPISSETLAKMEALDTTPSSPTLIRTYKMEAELEIWKMKSNGEYGLLKAYPMCRWSGQLGPKKREGDMQVPEGFYTIAPGQMNPNSHYYLAFNVGYPNAYDRAYGRTGGNVMVHGVCSSAGCFSMTDEQVADIYAIARDSFAGGQREIQLQSYPFHMTAENMAKFRLDPNIDFWKNLKDGSDHFEVTKAEPSVLICGKHYVFDATTKDEVKGSEPCPALKRDESVEALVAEKADKDETKVADLVASGVKPIHLVYADGARDRSRRPNEAGTGGGEDRHSRRGEKEGRERSASARRDRGGAAGSGDDRGRLRAREPIRRSPWQVDRRRQGCAEMAASGRPGARAATD
jgi:murein L,D-transpeptidase YafK